MNLITPDDVHTFLQNYLAQKLNEQGRELPQALSDDYDLLLSGVIDSLGVLELVAALQDNFDAEIDFERLDAEQMTVVGPLCEFVSQELRNGASVS